MARPKKNRMIAAEPPHRCFGCLGRCDAEIIDLSVDEYETIALLDGEGLSQEEAALRMGVARTTITAIYRSARKKIADFLRFGKRLSIGGGCYEVHDPKKIHGISERKGNKSMKIAISYDNEEVYQHFGQTPSFMIVEVNDKKISSSTIEKTNGVSHKGLVPWLKERGIDAVIVGGIGGMAISLLQESKIACYAGVEGKAKDALDSYLQDKLECIDEPTCCCEGEGKEKHCC